MFEVTGKIIEVGNLQSGVSAAGKEWAKKEYVLETLDKYPRKIAFTVFGKDKVESVVAEAGDVVDLKFTVESREYNGRWYTNINADFLDPSTGEKPAEEPAKKSKSKAKAKAEPEFKESDPADDLPF